MTQRRFAARPYGWQAAWTTAFLGLLVVVVVGCGPGYRAKGVASEEEKVMRVAGTVNAGEDRWPELFANSALPQDAEAERYKKYLYEMGEVSISGDTATVEVTVTDQSGKELGNTQWTLNKQGESWKITAARLPEGI